MICNTTRVHLPSLVPTHCTRFYGELRFNGLLVLDDKLLTILMLLQLRPLMRAQGDQV